MQNLIIQSTLLHHFKHIDNTKTAHIICLFGKPVTEENRELDQEATLLTTATTLLQENKISNHYGEIPATFFDLPQLLT